MIRARWAAIYVGGVLFGFVAPLDWLLCFTAGYLFALVVMWQSRRSRRSR